MLHEAVKFILSESNVVAIVYGTRLVKLSKSEIVELPSLTRKKTQFEIHKDYTNFVGNKEKLVSRATMFKLMNYLTSTNEAILTVFNYVTVILVNESCEIFQEVID